MSAEPNHGDLPAKELEGPPLYVIPCSSDATIVWCPLSDSRAIADIEVAGSAVTITERKKLFRPNGRLEALRIEGAHLRDGSRCDLHITSKTGDVSVVSRPARLARWEDPDTRSILKLLASRFGAERAPLQILDRYLAFISAWQAPGHLIGAFPDGCIVAVDIDFHGHNIDAYGVTARGFRSVTAQVLVQRAGQVLIWLEDPASRHLYLDLADTLVRVNLDMSPSLTSSRSAKIDGDEQALVEALHRVVERPSPELSTWAASHCKPRATFRRGHATLEVHQAVRLPSDEIAFFISTTGAACDVGRFNLAAFGAPDISAVDIAACDIEGKTSAPEQQIIVRAPAPEAANRCHRLTWTRAGQHASVWIREADTQDPGRFALARDFVPVAAVKPEVFPRVLHPVATAPGPDTAPGLVRVTDVGTEDDAHADVFVFAGPDQEAVHRTLVGLSLTSRETPFNVQLCLFDRHVMDGLAASVQEWSRAYNVPVRVSCYSARTSEAQVAQQAFSSTRPRIFCRAGAIPRSHAWLPAVLKQLEMGGRPLLLAADPRGEDNRSFTSLGSLLADDPRVGLHKRLVAAAVSPARKVTMAGLPRLYTLEAFILAQAALGAARDAGLPLCPDLNIVQSSTRPSLDEFQTRLDALSLQRLATSPLAVPRRVIAIRGRAAR